MLPRALNHDGNAQGTLLGFSRLGYPSPTYRWGCVFPVLGVNAACHDKSVCGFDGFDTVDACGFLALVLLCDPTNC
jgi:hypothetical protein